MSIFKKICIILTVVLITGTSAQISNAIEPIMQEKYTVQEQKVKRAYFIWTACIEELRRDGVLDSDQVDNIHKYLKDKMKTNNLELPLKRFEIEKNTLRVVTVDIMIKEKIITEEQGKLLKKKLNKYDLSNLE